MGFQLNGNTSLVIILVLALAIVGAITAIIISGNQVPEIFTVVLAALGSAVGAGAAVNHVNQNDTKTIAATAAEKVINSQPPVEKTN